MRQKLLCSLFCFLYAITMMGQEGNQLYGTLYDNETYDPVVGARVEILNYYPAKITYTDDDGKFILPDINAGRHRMLITADGFIDLQQGFLISSEQSTSLRISLVASVDEPKTLEEELDSKVTTTTKTAETIIDAPANTYVVSSRDIQERGYRYLVDVLEDIPEFEIQDLVDVEQFNKITVRGVLGNEKILILQDGVRISSTATTAHAIDKNYPIQHAKRIEVVLGPASALYGADAFTAVVNIITKDGANVQGVRLNSSYGMYHTIENNFHAGWQQGEASLIINGNIYRSPEPYMPNFYPEEYRWITNHYEPNGEVVASPFFMDTINIDTVGQAYSASREAYSMHAKFNWRTLEIGGSRREQGFSSSTGSFPEYSPYVEDNLWRFAINSAYAQYTFATKNQKFNITPHIGWNNYQLNPNTKFRNTFSGYDNAYKYAFSHVGNVKIDAVYNIHKYHKLVAGIEAQFMYALPKTSDLPFAWNSQDDNDFYYLGTNIEDADGNNLAISQELFYMRQFSGGGYLQYQFSFKDWLALTMGGRTFRMRFNTLDGAYSSQEYRINPRVGFVIKPSEKIRVKAFYGEAFLAPSPEKRLEHFGSFFPVVDGNGTTTGFAGAFWHLPNPNIQSERIRSAEVLTSLVTKNFSASINVYYNQVLDVTTTDVMFNDTFVGVPIDVIEIYTNNDQEQVFGSTFQFRYRKFFDANQRTKFELYGAYSYIDGRILRNGEAFPLPFTAKHTAKLGLTFTYRRLSLHTRGIFRSSTFNDAITDTNGNIIRQSNQPFFLMNAHIQYRVWQNFSRKFNIDLFVTGRNITNARYYNMNENRLVNLGNVPQYPIRIVGGFIFTFDNNGTKVKS